MVVLRTKKKKGKISHRKTYSNNTLLPTYIIGILYKAHKLTKVLLSVQSS